ncbi:MAG: ParB/RepB/Spo0J family partition protein [Blastocatellia bacterium]|nr:ParB/RepB/Spo0J family partition protein [Blastocatellia bacterium]HMZ82534.1 ParB/RepB/Spo0J family partition protein [Acidobacteriota bacterium]
MPKKKYQFQLPVTESRLSALSAMVQADTETTEVRSVPIALIKQNPYQPRFRMSEDELADLAASINQHGILQPLVARPENDGSYTLIAGHRRWQASKLLARETVPVIAREQATDEDLRLLALVENIQRVDLHAVDKAKALAEFSDRFPTQNDAAHALGMKREALANWLRVRQLSEEVLGICSELTTASLKSLLHLVQMPEPLRLREARRMLAMARAAEREHPTAKTMVLPQPKRVFSVRTKEGNLPFVVEVHSRSRKRAVTPQDFRAALVAALEQLDNETSVLG